MNTAGATADASLRSLIRARPLRVEALEDAFGYGFWDHLDDTLSEYCLSTRKDAESVLMRVSILDDKAIERDWMALPASDSLLHSVESAFAGLMASFVEKAGRLRGGRGSQSAFAILLAALNAYDAKIRAHTYLESAILFPKARIMENELVRRAKAAESGMRQP